MFLRIANKESEARVAAGSEKVSVEAVARVQAMSLFSEGVEL